MAILKLYPGATEERTFTFADIDRVTSERLQLSIQSKEELAAYHWQFLAITQYLILCNRLLANKQGRAFLQGFRSDVLQRIYQHLQIKFPDHFPNNPYMLAQIMDAASFIFAQQSVSFKPTQPPSATVPVHVPTAVRTADLSSMFENLAQTITTSFIAVQQAPAQSPSQSPTLAQYQMELVAQYWNTVPSPPRSPSNKCNFCSEEGHFIAACVLVKQYVEDGMICRNSKGKIVLPHGAYVPGRIPGRWLRERVDEWYRRTFPAMTNPTPAPVPIPTVPKQLTQEQINQIAEERAIDDHIAMLCTDMFALQTRKLQAITTCSNVSFSPSSSPSIATVPVVPSPVTAITIENPTTTSS